jgi:chromosomal replication initiator protein DnaA
MDTGENLKDIWAKAKLQLLETIPDADRIWINDLSYVSEGENELTLGQPSNFHISNFNEYCRESVSNTIDELVGKKIKLSVVVVKKTDNETTSTQPAPKKAERMTPSKFNADLVLPSKRNNSMLNPNYTFDSFVSGDNSLFAYTSAKAVAMNPGGNYNPFLLYGGVGLGKTHLLQSIGNYIEKDNPRANVIYITAEAFTNELIYSFGDKSTTKFKQKYRKADVLLIDDIHFLQKKEAIQEELFHTFNDLYEAHKQIVLTCDRPINELTDITDRLKSRFGRGLNVNLAPPPYEIRFAILRKKCEERNVSIDGEVLDYICQNIKTNVRDLEGALTTLIAYSELIKKKITLQIAEEQLKSLIVSPVITDQDISIYTIIKEVASYFNIDVSALKGKKKTKAISDARNIAIFLCRNMTDYSLTEIGDQFDKRDHSTVLYAINKINDAKIVDSQLSQTIDTIKQIIIDKSK